MSFTWLFILRFIGIFLIIHFETTMIELLGIFILVYATLKSAYSRWK